MVAGEAKMEPILMTRIAVLLAGCIAAAYTDAKTGLILDKITYPMILIGIILNLAEANWLFLGIGIGVFAIGYAVYYAGKVGGGDVKLLTAIAFLLPMFGGSMFLLNALFIAALLAVTFYAVYFAAKYWRTGINWRENRGSVKKAGLFGIVVIAYFFALVQMKLLAVTAVLILAVPLGFALVFMSFERGIRKNFFLEKVKLDKLGEDEVIALEFLDKKIKKKLNLKIKGVFGKEEIEKLKKLRVEQVPVYRGMPPFAPFILLGCIAALAQPDLISVLFL